MARILVTYASRTGSTADIAGWIADELRGQGHEVDLVPVPSDPTPVGYDLVVLGSGIRVRRLMHEAPEWVEAHEGELVSVPIAVFDVSLTCVVDPEHGHERSMHAIERLEERFPALRPVATGTFPGAYRPERLSLPERELVEVMGAEEGDFMDEAEVRRWADRLAALVPVPART